MSYTLFIIVCIFYLYRILNDSNNIYLDYYVYTLHITNFTIYIYINIYIRNTHTHTLTQKHIYNCIYMIRLFKIII